MSNEFVERVLAATETRRRLGRGSYLFHQGDRVGAVFVVDDGRIELMRHHRDGTTVVLQRASRGTLLAEPSVYSATYHCDAVVRAPAAVCELPRAVFLDWLREDAAFAASWAAYLAREVQSARFRSEILTRKTVAERLDGWLNWRDGELPPKGNWKDIAAQIGVSPEALYRELARRRSR